MNRHASVPAEIHRLQVLVERRLARRVRGFRLLVRPEGVVLQGQAASYYAKQLAQHAVMALTGLHILQNEIQVSLDNPAAEESPPPFPPTRHTVKQLLART